MIEDRDLERPQLRPGIEAELVGEDRPALLEDPQRIGLSTGAVQGQHQLASEPLAGGMCSDEGVEVTSDAQVATEGEVDIDALLRRRQAELLEASDVRTCEVLVREVSQRGPTPQRLRRREPLSRFGALTSCDEVPRLAHQAFEPVHVDVIRVDAEDVAGWPHRDGLTRLERLSELRHEALE